MTHLRMYANHKRIDLQNIQVKSRHDPSSDDCAGCDEHPQQIDVITRVIRLNGNLDKKQRTRLLEIANACPVHKTLNNKIQINTSLMDVQDDASRYSIENSGIKQMAVCGTFFEHGSLAAEACRTLDGLA